MNTYKKIISLMLCAVMVLSIMPFSNYEVEAATAQYAMMPLKKINVTQKAGGSYSHAGTKNVDFGTSQSLYAPFDCKVVSKLTSWDSGNTIVVESTSKVNFADGTNDYMCLLVAHDNNIDDLSVGKTIKQGAEFYHTGTYGNVTGEHVHMCVSKGKYAGQTQNSYGNWELKNSILPSNAFFINDSTVITNNGGYTWKKVPSSYTLSVYYNSNGGSISSDTYYLSSGVVYKISGETKLCHKWTYNNTQKNGLYDDTTFGIYKDGYSFVGWSTSASGGTVFDKSDNTIVPTDLNSNIKNGDCSVTLYAIWEKNITNYTLTYDANGGAEAPLTVMSDTNGSVILSSFIPERFGYSFVGWNESGRAEDGFYVPGQEITIYEDTTLYAVWNEFESTESCNDYYYLSAPSNVIYIKFVPEQTTAYKIITSSTEDDLDTIGALYDSQGTLLTENDDSSGGRNFMMYYSMYEGETYYIKVTSFNDVEGSFYFTISPDYIITYDANGGLITIGDSELLQTHIIEKIVPPIDIIREGYVFVGWSEESDATYATYTLGDELNFSYNATLYAVWQKNDEPSTTKPVEESTTKQAVTEPTTAEPTTTEPITKPVPVPTTSHVEEPTTKPVNKASVEIRRPSQTEISYGDSIILHADVKNLPEGAKIVWTADNANFTIVSYSTDKTTCTVTPSSSGDTVFTATVVDADGNEICSDTQTMTSKAGFFQKLIAFFKKLFGMTKIIPEVFREIL